jgi:hypothetical protein
MAPSPKTLRPLESHKAHVQQGLRQPDIAMGSMFPMTYVFIIYPSSSFTQARRSTFS